MNHDAPVGFPEDRFFVSPTFPDRPPDVSGIPRSLSSPRRFEPANSRVRENKTKGTGRKRTTSELNEAHPETGQYATMNNRSANRFYFPSSPAILSLLPSRGAEDL